MSRFVKEAKTSLELGFHLSAHSPVVEWRTSVHEPGFCRPLGGIFLPFSLMASDQLSQENFSTSCNKALGFLIAGKTLKFHLTFLHPDPGSSEMCQRESVTHSPRSRPKLQVVPEGMLERSWGRLSGNRCGQMVFTDSVQPR